MSRQYNQRYRHKWNKICCELARIYNTMIVNDIRWFLEGDAYQLMEMRYLLRRRLAFE